MNEAEHLMKNYGDRGGCYQPRQITALLIGYLVGCGACADRTHRSVTTVTVWLPAFML